MGDFLYGYVLGRVIFGIPVLVFKIMRFMLRIAWWLGLWVVLSIAAGLIAIARRGQDGSAETEGLGHFSEDEKLWQDEASGQVFRCSETDREHCELTATVAGQYWRSTALSRLMRRGAIWRYRFDAVTEAADGSVLVAATHEFPQEARVKLTLDHVDPAQASTDPYGLEQNREWALDALTHMDWLLTSRGWHAAGRTQDPSNQHWYCSRYERPVIFWAEPVAAKAAQGELNGSAARQAAAEAAE